ncbi:MAG: RDD family protein [Chitinophagales bacterium]
MEPGRAIDDIQHYDEPNADFASGWQRFGNYFIDALVIRFAQTLLAMYLFSSFDPFFAITMFLISYFAYYTILESTFGKTIGKWITNTEVRNFEDIGKITVQQALLRSLIRVVPFEPLSFFGSERGWHDKWSNTVVVRSNSITASAI